MPVNLDRPQTWTADIAASVDMYNRWFIKFAPKTFREARVTATKKVEATLRSTDNLTNIKPEIMHRWPGVLSTLRMSTCPPLAVDRLIGLANVPSSMIKRMEKENKLPVRLKGSALDVELRKIGEVIEKMADPDIFVWIRRGTSATEEEVYRAASIVADRLCRSLADPIIRNAQEQRQLANIGSWLESRGYTRLPDNADVSLREMPAGTFTFRMNVSVDVGDRSRQVNVPVDTVIMRRNVTPGELPLLVEAKSAGDFTNTNKRCKEEAQKVSQLRATYGKHIEFVLFLCGYFDSGYLGYEAAEGIDWIWEHRIDDLEAFGV